MVLNDLILSPIDCAVEAMNDSHSYFDDGPNSFEDKVGDVVIERTGHLLDSDTSLAFNQVDSSLELYRTKGFFKFT